MWHVDSGRFPTAAPESRKASHMRALGGRYEAGAHLDALGGGGEGRHHAHAIADAAGGHHGNVAAPADALQQGQQAYRVEVLEAATLGALHDQPVHTALHRFHGALEGGHRVVHGGEGSIHLTAIEVGNCLGHKDVISQSKT